MTLGERKGIYKLLIAASSVSTLIILITWQNLLHIKSQYMDSHWYIELAEGRPYNVMKPFSSRIFYPAIVRLIKTFGNFTIDQSFLIAGSLSLIILVIVVMLVIKLTTPYPQAAVFILFTPFLLSLFKYLYVPDLFHAALTGLFFVLILRHKMWPALLVLFFLCLTRPSTFLLSLVTSIILYKSQRNIALITIAITLVAIAITSFYARLGQPNLHNINGLLYMLLKIPSNFSRNILGAELWTDTIASFWLSRGNLNYSNPLLKMALPDWLPLGSIRAIGIQSFTPMRSLNTIKLLLTHFGVIPTFIIYDLAKNYKWTFNNSPLWLRIALVYGLLSFFMGTSVGATVERLIGYGWPAFWIGAPALMVRYYHADKKACVQLLFCNFFLCWVPWMINQSILFTLFIAFGLHYFTFKTIRKINLYP